VKEAMEANIEEKWKVIEAMSRKGGHYEDRL
jgi:hypothetical protein